MRTRFRISSHFQRVFLLKEFRFSERTPGFGEVCQSGYPIKDLLPQTLELHPLHLACFYYQVSWKPRHWLPCNFNLHKHFCHARVSFLSFPLPPDFLQKCRPILILFLSNQLLFSSSFFFPKEVIYHFIRLIHNAFLCSLQGTCARETGTGLGFINLRDRFYSACQSDVPEV